MKNIFKEWPSIGQRLQKSKNTLFLFDFDGTLSKIVQHPGHAKLGKKIKSLIRILSSLNGVSLGIVSGRPLTEIKRITRLNAIIVSGNHGFEAVGKNISFIHPKSQAIRNNLEKIISFIQTIKIPINGLLVENKTLTGSLHYRNVNSNNLKKVFSLINRIKPICKQYGFSIRKGKKVFEIIPALEWNKGHFVKWLEKKMGRPLIVYAGDDTTDEDVFHFLEKRGITIRIGSTKRSAASYFLSSQKDMPTLLVRFIESCS